MTAGKLLFETREADPGDGKPKGKGEGSSENARPIGRGGGDSEDEKLIGREGDDLEAAVDGRTESGSGRSGAECCQYEDVQKFVCGFERDVLSGG